MRPSPAYTQKTPHPIFRIFASEQNNLMPGSHRYPEFICFSPPDCHPIVPAASPVCMLILHSLFLRAARGEPSHHSLVPMTPKDTCNKIQTPFHNAHEPTNPHPTFQTLGEWLMECACFVYLSPSPFATWRKIKRFLQGASQRLWEIRLLSHPVALFLLSNKSQN